MKSKTYHFYYQYDPVPNLYDADIIAYSYEELPDSLKKEFLEYNHDFNQSPVFCFDAEKWADCFDEHDRPYPERIQ